MTIYVEQSTTNQDSESTRSTVILRELPGEMLKFLQHPGSISHCAKSESCQTQKKTVRQRKNGLFKSKEL